MKFVNFEFLQLFPQLMILRTPNRPDFNFFVVLQFFSLFVSFSSLFTLRHSVRPPGQIVAVKSVLFDPQNRILIRIVSEPLRVELNQIEPVSVAFKRIDRKGTAQKADSVSVIHHAAIIFFVTANRVVTIPELK